MNQQATVESTATTEQPLREWENSEWFREWLDCHDGEAATADAQHEREAFTAK